MRFFIKLFLLCVILPSLGWAIEFQKIHTKNGTQIWHQYTPNLPMVSMKISFPIGTTSDPLGKKGLATLVASTMDEGAGDLDSSAFQDLLNQYNMELHYSASHLYFTLNLSFLNYDKDIAIKLAGLSLSEPRFDKDAVDLMKSQIIAMLENKKASPTAIAGHIARNIYFGDHPYHYASDGVIKDIQNIKNSDLKKFKDALGQKDAFVAIAGDISKKDAESITESILKNIPVRNTKNSVILSKYSPNITERHIFVPFKVPQTQVLMTSNGVFRDDADFMSSFVALHILGSGGFSSRLIESLREKNGLTYNVSSYISNDAYNARLLINYATGRKTLEKSLEITKQTLADMVEKGITQKELDNAVRYLKGYYPLQFSTNEELVALAQSLYEDGLSNDYPQKRDALLDALTVQSVSNSAQKLLKQKFQIVTVGGQEAPKGYEMMKAEDIVF